MCIRDSPKLLVLSAKSGAVFISLGLIWSRCHRMRFISLYLHSFRGHCVPARRHSTVFCIKYFPQGLLCAKCDLFPCPNLLYCKKQIQIPANFPCHTPLNWGKLFPAQGFTNPVCRMPFDRSAERIYPPEKRRRCALPGQEWQA